MDFIEDHFREQNSNSSLGVITFSIAQEEAIWEEWEQRKIQKPDLEALSEINPSEPFFIKSLEKVQGDERDRIIISLGYGHDTKGILSMNFGPINQAGGEKRLNVVVTRAKEKVILVSSILPQEIDLSRLSTRSSGVAMLQKYLEYAYQGGRMPTQTYGGGEPESDFEYDVKERLEARGLDVDAQIGCSGFRIDLAIKHPKQNNSYILGVECDGATYHSHRSARDRDRLRQEVLEKLGWRIYRVWSTDWIKNPDRIVDDIYRKVQEFTEERGIQIIDNKKTNLEQPHEDLHKYQGEQNPNIFWNNIKMKNNSHVNNTYGFKIYKKYIMAIKKSYDHIYYAEYYRNYLQNLTNDIQMIVKEESPIHMNAIVNRIATVYGIKKTGTRIQRIIKQAIKLGVQQNLFQKNGEFLWSGNSVLPRVPEYGESPRPIEEIAIEEIMTAVEIIVKKEIGITRESLISTTARVFGYNRTGANIEDRINAAIQQLLQKGLFSTYGDQIILTHKDT